MPRIAWTEQAVADLFEILQHLAEHDQDAALAAQQVINRSVGMLEQFPEAGRPAPDLDPEQRELLVPFGVSGYLVLYEPIADMIAILAIRHQRQAGY